MNLFDLGHLESSCPTFLVGFSCLNAVNSRLPMLLYCEKPNNDAELIEVAILVLTELEITRTHSFHLRSSA